MYRAAGLAVMRAGISLDDEKAVSAACERANIAVSYANGAQRTYLDGEDVSEKIRTQEAGAAASAVSRFKGVREKMVAAQRALSKDTSMLLDGRDIGTVVLPHADVKIFLTASCEARARRRMNQLREKGADAPYEEILREVRARDEQDEHRAVDPLRKASDALLVDSSALTFEETVRAILRAVEEKRHV